MNPQILDFIAGFSIQIGNYYKIRKNKVGWLISICATLYWMQRGISMGLYSQTFWHAFSLITASYGFYVWNKGEK